MVDAKVNESEMLTAKTRGCSRLFLHTAESGVSNPAKHKVMVMGPHRFPARVYRDFGYPQDFRVWTGDAVPHLL